VRHGNRFAARATGGGLVNNPQIFTFLYREIRNGRAPAVVSTVRGRAALTGSGERPFRRDFIMSRTKLGLTLTIPVLALSVLGAALFAYLSAGATAPTFVTGTVTRGDIVKTVASTGTLEAVTTVQVGTQVSGIVKDLLADFNDIVRKGQVLARLDPSSLEAQLEQAAASLVKAEADADRSAVARDDARAGLARTEALAARNLVPAADLDAGRIAVRTAEAQLLSAKAGVTQARASVNQARVNLAHAVITSPIDAVVISRSVDAGQTVAASMSAPTLYVLAADLTRMRVIAKLDESDIAAVKEGNEVTFRVDAYPGETFAGRVSQVRLQGEVVSNVVTYTTVIDVANPALKLKPGMTANVSVEVAQSLDTLRVPSAALRFRPTTEQLAAFGLKPDEKPASGAAGGKGAKSASVWRVAGQAIERVAVETGLTDGSWTELTGGALRVDDRLLTSLAAATTASAKTTKTTATSNPLMGGGMQGPPPGGPR
jgi:HlyD family secretion protein